MKSCGNKTKITKYKKKNTQIEANWVNSSVTGSLRSHFINTMEAPRHAEMHIVPVTALAGC